MLHCFPFLGGCDPALNLKKDYVLNFKLEVAGMQWSPFATVYDPLKAGSIDGTDVEPHDRAVVRAINSEYKPDKKIKSNPSLTIFVARLDRKTNTDTILHEFSRYGKIVNCRLVRDIVTGRSKGYAFIEYESEDAADEAYRYANGKTIDGRKIFVDYECERLLPGWKPRRLGGGFGGRKESGQLRFGGRDRPFKKPLLVHVTQKQGSKMEETKMSSNEAGQHYRMPQKF